MSDVNVKIIGRFGNQLFQYAHARAYCEKYGHTLHCDRWLGTVLFNLPHPAPYREFPERNEDTANGDGEITLSGYFQNQASLIYTREQVRQWFNLSAYELWVPSSHWLMHKRRGDYGACGYVVVSDDSYTKAALQFGYAPDNFENVTEEQPYIMPGTAPKFHFLGDFMRMVRAHVLFRGNSSFSWWAATLSNAKVYSPVIENIPGGEIPRDVPFVEGNHPRFCSLHFVTDLHLK